MFDFLFLKVVVKKMEQNHGILSCSYCQKKKATSLCGHGCLEAVYCGQICADIDYKVHQYKCVGNVQELLNKELETEYGANKAEGIMFVITGKTKKGETLVLLGLERGGAYKNTYNMFGGQHDKRRTRAATAQAEFCEEFGAAAQGNIRNCKEPTLEELLEARKIFANLSIEHDGPSATTIIILWDLGDKFPSRREWNENNRIIHKNPNIGRSYKEMLQLQIFRLSDLIAEVKTQNPVRPWGDEKDKVPVSWFTFQTIRDMDSLGFFRTKEIASIGLPAAIPFSLIEASWLTQTRFYKASIAKMRDLLYHDPLAWWGFQIYQQNSYFNTILFRVKADWTKFNNRFDDVGYQWDEISKFLTPANPYGKFATFFASTLFSTWRWQESASQRGFAFPGGVKRINSPNELIQTFPQLVPYFKMSNARFTWEILYKMQQTILSMPRIRSEVYVWRGYAPLNLPNTLTLDISRLKVKQRITTWAFLSVAIDPVISALFVHPTPSTLNCCMLRITIPPGHPVFLLSGNKAHPEYQKYSLVLRDATEILLPAGVIVEITKKSRPRRFKNQDGSEFISKMADAKVVGYANINYFPKPK